MDNKDNGIQMAEGRLGRVVVLRLKPGTDVLLGLQEHNTTFDGVYSAGIYLDKVTRLHRDLPDKLLPSALLNHITQFLPVLGMMSDDQRRILITIQNVPALCLSKGTILMYLRICIIRVNLYTEIRFRINNLCQERESVVPCLSKKFRMVFPQFR